MGNNDLGVLANEFDPPEKLIAVFSTLKRGECIQPLYMTCETATERGYER